MIGIKGKYSSTRVVFLLIASLLCSFLSITTVFALSTLEEGILPASTKTVDITTLLENEEQQIMEHFFPLSDQEQDYIVLLREKPLSTYKTLNPSRQRIKLLDIEEKQRTKVKALKEKGIKVKETFKNVNRAMLASLRPSQVLALEQDPEVQAVLPDIAVELQLGLSVPLLHAPEVWQEELIGVNITGEGITIAVIDTGVDYTHPDLGGCLGPGCKVIGGYDFVNNDTDPMDDHFHGTHCAATAAGKNYDGNGLDGVAPEANIIALKVLNENGEGKYSDILRALEYIVDLDQDGIPFEQEDTVDIASMSIGAGGISADSEYALLIDHIVEAGVVVVVAAGNIGPNPMTIGLPGTARKAITVGASNNDLGLNSSLIISEEEIESLPILFSLRGSVSAPIKKVPGYGRVEDYSADYTDTIVLVERGEISFLEKAQNALAAGAQGILIYNNEPGPFSGSLAEQTNLLAASLSLEQGTELYDRISQGEILVATLSIMTDPDYSEKIAFFSSRGPVLTNQSEQIIKPDVLAPGVSICAATLPDIESNCGPGQHIYSSGTSMATPHVAGIAALVKQAHPEWTAEKIKAAITSGTVDTPANGTTQGNGLVRADYAVNSNKERVIILNNTLNMGRLNQEPGSAVRATTTIINEGESTKIFEVTTESTHSFVDYIHPQSISVSPQSSVTLELEIISHGFSEIGYFEGKLQLKNPEENHTIPFLFFSTIIKPITVKFPEAPQEYDWVAYSFIDSETLRQIETHRAYPDENREVHLYFNFPEDKPYYFIVNHDFREVLSENYDSVTRRGRKQILQTHYFYQTKILPNTTEEYYDIRDLPITMKFNPVLANGELFIEQKKFNSYLNVRFGENNWPMLFSSKSTVPFTHDFGQGRELIELDLDFNSTLRIKTLDEPFTLQYTAFNYYVDDKKQQINFLKESIPVQSGIYSNTPEEYVRHRDLSFEYLKQWLNQAYVSVVDYYNYGGTAITLSNKFEKTSINLSKPVELWSNEEPDEFFLDHTQILVTDVPGNISEPGIFKYPSVVSMEPINRYSSDTITEQMQPYRFLNHYGHLNLLRDRKVFQEFITKEHQLGMPPYVYTAQFNNTQDLINFTFFGFSQSGDHQLGVRPFNLMVGFVNFTLVQEDISMSAMNFIAPTEFPLGQNIITEIFFPSISQINMSKPVLMSFKLLLPNNLLWNTPKISFYEQAYFTNFEYRAYYNAQGPDYNPPTLVDIDVLTSGIRNSYFSSEQINNLTLTYSDETALKVFVSINGSSVPTKVFGDQNHITRSSRIEEEQKSGHWADLSKYNFVAGENYSVEILTVDNSSNYAYHSFTMPANNKITCADPSCDQVYGWADFDTLSEHYDKFFLQDIDGNNYVTFHDILYFGKDIAPSILP